MASLKKNSVALEDIEYIFYRWTIIVMSLLPIAIYLYINFNTLLGIIMSITLIVMQIIIILFSILEFKVMNNLKDVLYYRYIQFWLYRLFMLFFISLLIWTIVIMLK